MKMKKINDPHIKSKINKIMEKAKPLIEAKKVTVMKKRQGKFSSKNENLCCIRLREILGEKHPELEVVDSDIETLPGWEIDILIKGPYEWRLAIEWDGAYHRKPIYGESKLKMRQAQDKYKDKALYSKKYA